MLGASASSAAAVAASAALMLRPSVSPAVPAGLALSSLAALGAQALSTRLSLPYLSVAAAARAHWQSLPAGVASVCILLCGAAAGGLPRWGTVVAGGACAILSVASVALERLLPMPRVARPSGRWAVGTKTYELRAAGARRLAVQVWYPAAARATATATALWTSGHPASAVWESDAAFSALAKFIRMPRFIFSHLLRCAVEATHAAALASPPEAEADGAARWPIVVFSHGLYGSRGQNTQLAGELASHGFVVVATDHHPDALRSVFPLSAHTLPYAYAVPAGSTTQQEREHWIAGLDRRVRDLQSVLDRLAEAAHPDADLSHVTEVPEGPSFAQLARTVNARNVLACGHSYGGGTAVALGRRDARVRAVVGLDAWMWCVPDHDYLLPRRTPTLFLSADLWASAHAQMPARARMAATHPASVDLVIRATGHHSYNDVGGLASPTVMRAGNKVGPLPHATCVDVVGACVLHFASVHLRATPPPGHGNGYLALVNAAADAPRDGGGRAASLALAAEVGVTLPPPPAAVLADLRPLEDAVDDDGDDKQGGADDRGAAAPARQQLPAPGGWAALLVPAADVQRDMDRHKALLRPGVTPRPAPKDD